MSLETKISSDLDNIVEARDRLSFSVPDDTGVYNATTNPTGYGASQVPTNKRRTSDIIDSTLTFQKIKESTEYTKTLDTTTTPTAKDFADGTSNVDIDNSVFDGASTDILDDNVIRGTYKVNFSDLKIADLSGTMSAAYNAGVLASSIADDTYLLYIVAIDGGGNLSNATNSGVSIVHAGGNIDAYLTFTGVANAVSYRIYLKGATHLYYKNTTSTTVTFASATTTTTDPTSLTTNNTKSYIKYNSSDDSFETQGIIQTSWANIDIIANSHIKVDGTLYTVASILSSYKLTVSESHTLTNGTYYEVYSVYMTIFQLLLILSAEKCWAENAPKIFAKFCCSNNQDERTFAVTKMWVAIVAAKASFIDEAYTDAQTQISCLTKMCTTKTICATCQ